MISVDRANSWLQSNEWLRLVLYGMCALILGAYGYTYAISKSLEAYKDSRPSREFLDERFNSMEKRLGNMEMGQKEMREDIRDIRFFLMGPERVRSK